MASSTLLHTSLEFGPGNGPTSLKDEPVNVQQELLRIIPNISLESTLFVPIGSTRMEFYTKVIMLISLLTQMASILCLPILMDS